MEFVTIPSFPRPNCGIAVQKLRKRSSNADATLSDAELDH
jgi:hypothetical protein